MSNKEQHFQELTEHFLLHIFKDMLKESATTAVIQTTHKTDKYICKTEIKVRIVELEPIDENEDEE